MPKKNQRPLICTEINSKLNERFEKTFILRNKGNLCMAKVIFLKHIVRSKPIEPRKRTIALIRNILETIFIVISLKEFKSIGYDIFCDLGFIF